MKFFWFLPCAELFFSRFCTFVCFFRECDFNIFLGSFSLKVNIFHIFGGPKGPPSHWGPPGTPPGRPLGPKRLPWSAQRHPKEAKIKPKTLPRATRRPTAIEKHFRSNFGLNVHWFGHRKSLANRTRILEKTPSKVPSTDLADLRFDRARSSGIDFRQKAGSTGKRGNLTMKSTETTSKLTLSTTPFRNRF